MLCRADSIGVFQVESRAQMATLPRLQAPDLLRPGGRGGPHPARARSRADRCTPTSAAATARSRSPTCTRCSSASLAKTLGVPLFQEQLMQMAIDVAGFTAGRGRPAAPGHGLQAQPRAHGAAAGPPLRRDGRAGHHRRGGRPDLRQAGRLRQLRLPREPLGVVRLPRLLQLVDQAALPGRLLRRAAQRPAHGLLLAPHPGAGRPPPRRRGAAPPTSTRPAPRRHAWKPGRPRLPALDRPVRPPLGWRRCATWATTWPSASWPNATPAGPTATWRTCERRVPMRLDVLEALATAGAFGCFADPDGRPLDRRRALWGAGAVAQTGPDRLAGHGHRGARPPRCRG